MSDRNRLIELYKEASMYHYSICSSQKLCKGCPGASQKNCRAANIVDYLIANGVTLQQNYCCGTTECMDVIYDYHMFSGHGNGKAVMIAADTKKKESMNERKEYVEVVRCKYCSYSKQAKINENGFKICPVSGMEITDYDFCSYGDGTKQEK